jgi:hypothetical protein
VATSQHEADAMWQNACYMLTVADCHRTRTERKRTAGRNSVRWWQAPLVAACYQPLPAAPHEQDLQLNFPEVRRTYESREERKGRCGVSMNSLEKQVRERFGELRQDRHARQALISEGRAEFGRTLEFVPQRCGYCLRYATSMPVCECGESYCSPECRLADWDSHRKICAQAMPGSMLRKVNKAWLVLRKGYTKDAEGRAIEIHYENGDEDATTAAMMDGLQEGCAQK